MKKTAIQVSDWLLRAAIRMKSKRMSRGLPKDFGHVILAPSSRGNLGDEAMLTSAVANIVERSSRPVTILIHQDDDDWSDIAPTATQVSIQGFFSAASFLQSLSTLREVFEHADSFAILGADVMDGAYSRSRTFRRLAMAEYAIRLGVSTRVLGFSYSDRANPQSKEYLRKLSSTMELFGRDKFSFERLREISEGPVQLVADTAFLLKPADPPSQVGAEALAFISESRQIGAKVISFNANPLGSSMSAGAKRGSEQVQGLDNLITRHVEAILAKDPKLNLVFVPHDPREPHSDRSLLQSVYDAQSDEIKKRIFCAFEGLTARDVKAICGACDLSVTGRMHMGIASLGAGTPCLFLDFQGKVLGLLSHFQVDDMYFNWELYSDVERFSEFIFVHLEKSSDLREKITGEIPRVSDLSRLNFLRYVD